MKWLIAYISSFLIAGIVVGVLFWPYIESVITSNAQSTFAQQYAGETTVIFSGPTGFFVLVGGVTFIVGTISGWILNRGSKNEKKY